MTLDAEVTQLLRERISPELEDSRERFAQEALAIDNSYSARGLGRSGAIVEALDEAAAKVLSARVKDTWNALRTILGVVGVRYYEGLAEDLKSAIAVNTEHVDLAGLVTRRARSMGMSVSGTTALERARRIELQRVASAIDLYVRALKVQIESLGVPSGSLVQNFYGPVGAVQTGTGSSATVTQYLDSGQKEALLNALELVKRSVAPAESWAGTPTRQITELIVESCSEIEKPQPNMLKVGWLARGVATAIQTVGSLRPAYDALRSALSLIGVNLPAAGDEL